MNNIDGIMDNRELGSDGNCFFNNGPWYLPFPDEETLSFWQKIYDDGCTDTYTKDIIIGRIEFTKKYFSQREELALVEILNKMMEGWWKWPPQG